MPRNGSGTYSLPSGNPVVTGSTISSTDHNTTMSDVASALTASLAKDGQTTPTANLKMGGFRFTGLGAGSANGHSVRYEQVFDGSGGTTVPYLPTGTGAAATTVQEKLREIVSVTDFGAVGDGSTDDATAIQAAITYACSVIGSVYFPKTGNLGYKIGTGLSVTAPIRLFGDSADGSYLNTASDINAITFTNAASGASIEDLQIIGPGTGTSTKSGVVASNSHDLTITRCYIRAWKYGVYFLQNSGSCYNNSIRDSRIVSNGTANIYCEAETNALGVFGTQFGGGAATGIRFYGSNSLSVIGGGCEGNTLSAIDIDAGSALQVGAAILGVHFEANTSSGGDIRLGATARVDGIYIAGNLFSPAAGADSAINANNVLGLVVLGNAATSGYTGTTFFREGTIDGLVYQNGSDTAQQGGVRIAKNYRTPFADNLAPLAATTYDSAHSDSGNFNQYRINSGSLTASKNFFAGVDAVQVASSGTPGASSSIYARAFFISNAYGAGANTRATLAMGAEDSASYAMTYSSSMTVPANYASHFVITATDNVAFAINAPISTAPALTGITGVTSCQVITITIRNTSGGALGTATWNAVFKMASWTQPATGYSRSITFKWNGTNWIEIGRTAADIPN